ncbi:MAG: hypothetical protein [Bacteriophage sp.]|nr:MAG: hypothetical protein [Bacteriophage sp.]
MDESRKAFEQWALEVMQFTPDDLTWDEKRNCYRDYVPHMAWKGWQASRAAIEIDAPAEPFYPMPKENSPTDHYHYGRQSIISKVRADGIKVKE